MGKKACITGEGHIPASKHGQSHLQMQRGKDASMDRQDRDSRQLLRMLLQLARQTAISKGVCPHDHSLSWVVTHPLCCDSGSVVSYWVHWGSQRRALARCTDGELSIIGGMVERQLTLSCSMKEPGSAFRNPSAPLTSLQIPNPASKALLSSVNHHLIPCRWLEV